MRYIALFFAYIFLALAIAGVALPGLPTVPFLLLAAWFAARGSARLHRWIYAHPHLGKLLIDWEEQRAISRSSKKVALVMLLVSWIVMCFQVSNNYLLAGITVFFFVMAGILARWTEPVSDN